MILVMLKLPKRYSNEIVRKGYEVIFQTMITILLKGIELVLSSKLGSKYINPSLRSHVLLLLCLLTSGQSYKQFTLVIYDSRVLIWGIFKSGTTLEF